VLSTLAADAATRYLATNGTSPRAQALAQLDSYHTAFLTSSGVFVTIAVLAFFLLRWGRIQTGPGAKAGEPAEAPVVAH
jgi:hypothetical protein